MNLSKQQIGKCGELLTQLELLKNGIESSPMTTDTGVDLVAFSSTKNRPFTIQVKTNLKAKPSGGKGKNALDWYVPINNNTDYISLVCLKNNKVWLIPWKNFKDLAQQKSEKNFHFIMYVDPTAKDRPDGKPHHEHKFSEYLLGNMIHKW